MVKKLFSHTAIYGIASQIPRVVGIFTLPIITVHLTQLDFGVFGLITAVIGAISVFNNLGLNIILSNTFIKNPNHYKWIWRQIYGFLILWNIPYTFLLGIIIYLFIPVEAMSNAWGIILLNVLPVILFGPTAILGTYYYQLNQKPFQIVIRSVCIGILVIILNIWFIAYLKLGYLGWFLSVAIGQILLQASYWIPLYFKLKITPIFNFKRKYMKQRLRISFPTILHFYGGYLLDGSDRLVMKLVGIPIGDIGLYNSANTVSNPFLSLGSAAGQAISPMLLRSYKNKDSLLTRKLIFTLQIIFLGSTFIVSVWVKEIFGLLIKNPSLHSAYPLAILLIMAYSYRPMYFGANYHLFYYEKTKVLLKITFIAGIGNIILNLILMPFFGYKIAAYTTFIGLMYMGYIGYFLKEFRESSSLSFYPLFWLLLTIFLTILAYIIVEFSLFVKMIVSFITISICLYFLIRINKKDKNKV